MQAACNRPVDKSRPPPLLVGTTPYAYVESLSYEALLHTMTWSYGSTSGQGSSYNSGPWRRYSRTHIQRTPLSFYDSRQGKRC